MSRPKNTASCPIKVEIPIEFPPLKEIPIEVDNEKLILKSEYLSVLSDKDLKSAILSKKKISKEIIKNAIDGDDFTSIFRLASIKNCCDKEENGFLFTNLVEALDKYLHVRGVPINSFIKDEPLKLHSHQINAINYVRSREMNFYENNTNIKKNNNGIIGSILKLEMGLGKTLCAIFVSLMSKKIPILTSKYGENGFPTLIVASKTIMTEWKSKGFEKFFGENVKVLYYHTTYITKSHFEKISRKELVTYDFVVTTYDVVSNASKAQEEIESNNIIYTLEGMGSGQQNREGICSDAAKIKHKHYISCRTLNNSDDYTVKGPRILFNTPWERIIADESQRFANPKIHTYKSMMNLYGRYKLCLTGTPIKNFSTDLWAQLRWCGYDGIKKESDWIKSGEDRMKSDKLNNSILSIDFKDTEITLPDKTRIIINCQFSEMEKKVYDYVLGVTSDVYDLMMRDSVNFACVLALFTRLRQLCIAPYLITSESKRYHKNGENDVVKKRHDKLAKNYLQKLYDGGEMSKWIHDINGGAGLESTKIQKIISLLKEAKDGEQTLIFSTFTSCLDLIGKAIEKYMPDDYIYDQLDGETPAKERSQIIEDFGQNKAIRCLLMTYKVGSEGINLTTANRIIAAEPWWTPVINDQADSRVHRIGQTNQVYSYSIFVDNTIEQRILKICNDKKEMANRFLSGTDLKTTGVDKLTLGKIIGIY